MKQWLQRRETNVNLYVEREVRPSQVVGRFTVFWGGMPEPQLFLTSEDLVKQNFALYVCRRNGNGFNCSRLFSCRMCTYDVQYISDISFIGGAKQPSSEVHEKSWSRQIYLVYNHCKPCYVNWQFWLLWCANNFLHHEILIEALNF